MDFRRLAIFTTCALVALAVFLLWLWSPQKQVRIHTEHFLKAVEQRDWKKAQAFVAEDYSDRWGHDKPAMLADSREAFAQFLFLTMKVETVSCEPSDSSWRAKTRVRLSGSGGPLAQLVIERVNELRQPFLLEWKRRSKKPWDWQLTRADQPELADRF